MKILVMGASARAVAHSVAESGHEPLGVDYFGDCDLRKIAEWRMLDKSTPLSVTAESLSAEGAVWASGIENRPEMITELKNAGIKVFSSSCESIKRCRDLEELEKFCAARGFRRPRTSMSSPPGDDGGEWLVKRVKSGAGIGVMDWKPGSGAELQEGRYIQERIAGVSISAVFLADGRDAVLCGASRQLAGEPSLGAEGYAWCGNIMPFEAPPGERSALLRELARLAGSIALYFGLSGAVGVDCVLSGGKLYILEINPRICASFELVELTRGLKIFDLHMRALEGELPREFDGLLDGPRRGKGIVYAPQNLTAPDTGAWYNYERRDIPRSGSPLPAGAPICTVLTPPFASDAEVMAYLGGEAAKIWKECGL
ncbi:MAG: ATP-grasp domain-containing protein [Synergistaceae bacterium]|jgi:predicted ATP-grasp superfamily ATP-dependent carboligase|nr:ATP-grasp domain-containing protein [Synergistaceae bacterium]